MSTEYSAESAPLARLKCDPEPFSETRTRDLQYWDTS